MIMRYKKGDKVRVMESEPLTGLAFGTDAVVEHEGETPTLRYFSERTGREEYASIPSEKLALRDGLVLRGHWSFWRISAQRPPLTNLRAF